MKPLLQDYERLLNLTVAVKRRQRGAFELIVAITLALIVIPTATLLIVRNAHSHGQNRSTIIESERKASWSAEKIADADCSQIATIGATSIVKCRSTTENDGDLIDEILLGIDE